MNIYRSKYLSYALWRIVLTNPRLRRVLQNIFYPNTSNFRNLLGASVFINSQKELGYYRATKSALSNVVFRDEVPKLMALMSLIRTGTTFVDCGANVGLWSAQFAKMGAIVKDLKVMAFEANSDTFSRLKKTCDQFTNVQCFNVALSDSARTLDMVEGAVSGVFGVHESDFQIARKSHKVQALPLDDFLADARDIVMKVDVEGHEWEVVKGAERVIKSGNLRAILLDGILERNKAVMLAFLADHNFSIYDCDTLQRYSGGTDRVLAIRAAGDF